MKHDWRWHASKAEEILAALDSASHQLTLAVNGDDPDLRDAALDFAEALAPNMQATATRALAHATLAGALQ